MHFDDFPLQPFLDSFLHPTVLTFSSNAEIISEIFNSFIFFESKKLGDLVKRKESRN